MNAAFALIVAAAAAAGAGTAYAQEAFDDECAVRAVENDEFFLTECGYEENFLQAAVSPFQNLLGGYLPLLFWGVVIFISYVRYHNAILSAMVGVPVLLGSAILLPNAAAGYVTLMLGTAVAVGIFILVWKIPRD